MEFINLTVEQFIAVRGVFVCWETPTESSDEPSAGSDGQHTVSLNVKEVTAEAVIWLPDNDSIGRYIYVYCYIDLL